MANSFRHYGWECSPYSSKTRAYLRYKGIEHEDIYPTAYQMKRIVEKRVGFIIMPVVTRGELTLQDSSVIIDQLETEYAMPNIEPPGPTQQMANLLLEFHADEWLPMMVMHTRWNRPTNRDFAMRDFGANAFPWAPSFLHPRLGQVFAGKMQSYLPILGVNSETMPAIDEWVDELLNTLEKHFEHHDYVLGGRPCLGDFALYGPIFAHIFRDPGTTSMVMDRPHLLNWVKRIQNGNQATGDFVPNDVVPATLNPIFKRVFNEQFPVLERTVARVDQWLDKHPQSKTLPRALGMVEFNLGGVRSERKLLTFAQWMFQRSGNHYKALEETDRQRVDEWLESIGGAAMKSLKPKYTLTRERFRVVPQWDTAAQL